MKQYALCFAMTLAAAGAFAAPTLADPTTQSSEAGKLKLEDCPKPVQATLKKEVGTGKIQELSRKQENGKTLYEADAHIDGKNYDIEVAEDGKLVSMTQE